MVSPLFPALTPRYVDEHWFYYDQLFEEDSNLSGLEREYNRIIFEIENREFEHFQENAAVFSDHEGDNEDDYDNIDDDDDEDDDDEDDDDDDDDEVDSDESDNEEDFDDDLFNLNAT
ncbi:hypothetical protein SSS_10260 [Sarcoptes scabiei]|uniref:Uncharacterized protein n=1 Tax=Sarcoptes scabiei TaxID=52283 RepID=A0A132AK62_SARSC|nr:hypothetical protein SSS_10260 [Sarcoptes scabiei]KPM10955.1 hypothetical protein QR98_0095200 [Sarcoptes scabiei]